MVATETAVGHLCAGAKYFFSDPCGSCHGANAGPLVLKC